MAKTMTKPNARIVETRRIFRTWEPEEKLRFLLNYARPGAFEPQHPAVAVENQVAMRLSCGLTAAGRCPPWMPVDAN